MTKLPFTKHLSRSSIVALASMLALAVGATAGSLTPPGAVSSTMNTLAEVYSSIAGTFDSTSIVANQNGSLMQNLKYIEANLSNTRPASNSLDFDEFVDSMNLDANTSIASHGFSLGVLGNFGIGIAVPTAKLQIVDNGGASHRTVLLVTNGGSGKASVSFDGGNANLGLFSTNGTRNVMLSSNTASSSFIAGNGIIGATTANLSNPRLTIITAVANAGHGSGLLITTSAGGYLASISSDNATGSLGLFSGNNQPKIVFNAHTASASYFNNGGNVGIATTTPTHGQLEINSGVAALGAHKTSFVVMSSGGGVVASISADSVPGGVAGSIGLFSGDPNSGPSIVLNGFTSSASYFNAGNLGVGTTNPTTKFQVNGSASISRNFELTGTGVTTGTIASISGSNLTTGSIFNITLPASSSANNPHGLMLVKNTNGTTVASWSMGGALSLAGKIYSDGANSSCTGVNLGGSGCIDYAESFPSTDATLSAGDIVTVDAGQSANVRKADTTSVPLGIVSTNPASLITGSGLLSGSSTLRDSPLGTVPIALAGRVPVKFSDENGSVVAGDHLTVSATKPGYAMKATTAGTTIGITMEASNPNQPTLMTFVNLSYWAPSVPVGATIAENPGVIGSIFTAIIQKFADFFHIVFGIGTIQTNTIKADTLCAGDTCVNQQQLQELLQRSRIQPASTPTPSDTPTPSPSDIPASGSFQVTPIPTPVPTETPTLTPADTPTPSPSETPTP